MNYKPAYNMYWPAERGLRAQAKVRVSGNRVMQELGISK